MNPLPASARPSDFGLVAWLENTRVALPLKGVECNFQVTGTIACVELDQIYHQNTNRPLDCTYTFPLPAAAAVYRCELQANGRVIRAKVEDRENAKRIFREQKAAGHRTALVERERANLFTLSLGNVQPGDVIVVRLAWFQPLDRSSDGLRLLIPTCPGVRYIPGQPLLRSPSGLGTSDDTDQVPDASRITPPRIDALHPDAAYLSIAGRLSSADVEPGSASSPSHPVCLREAHGVIAVELFGRDAVPDRDFVLGWKEPTGKELTPQSWRWTERGETYAVVQLRAPESVKVADGFPQDFYFLIDRSGSMAGRKWDRTCDALHAFVGLLGAADRVSITLFASDYRDFSEAPMPAPRVTADRGFQGMRSLGADGGTELLPAVTHVLQQIATHSTGKRTTVVLITDGEVGNDQAIVNAFRQAPQIRVHTFGIDTTVNDAFLKSLARQQGGGCWLQTPDDDITGTIAALGDRLRRPVLTELSVCGGWEASRSTWPDLHAREIVTIALRGNASRPLEITGRLPDGRMHCFDVELGRSGSEAVKLLWANERIATLIESGRRQEAIALAKQHNLICDGTAFIAWDEAERIQVAQQEIVQPCLVPAPMAALRNMAFFDAPTPLLCDTLDASADYAARDVCMSESRDRVGEAMTNLQSTTTPDLVNRRITAVRKFLQGESVAESIIAAAVAWTHEDGTLERLRTLEDAMELAAELRRRPENPITRGILERGLREALASSRRDLVRWTERTRRALQLLAELTPGLRHAEASDAVIDHLFAWVLETGEIVPDRLERLRTFVASLGQLPFSVESKARHWRTFLHASFSRDSRAWANADSWILELETMAGMKVS
jgi:Ca-activated chloride channel family protein